MAQATEAQATDALDTRAAIIVDDLDVRYKVRNQGQPSIRKLFSSGFRTRSTTTVESLRHVSLSVRTGEVVGVVGRNGSGKSTLLGAIAGLVPPARGTVLVRHQPTLLAVSAALLPRLSGTRNVTIGALAMGLTMSDVPDVQRYVAEFTELGDALDRPLNTYSSGMRARLAFAIATYRSPDIMLIDEALAVGDQEFRAKSLNRIREMQAEASTVLMVTHHLTEIRRTCSRAIWLNNGEIRDDGDVETVLSAYENDG